MVNVPVSIIKDKEKLPTPGQHPDHRSVNLSHLGAARCECARNAEDHGRFGSDMLSQVDLVTGRGAVHGHRRDSISDLNKQHTLFNSTACFRTRAACVALLMVNACWLPPRFVVARSIYSHKRNPARPHMSDMLHSCFRLRVGQAQASGAKRCQYVEPQTRSQRPAADGAQAESAPQLPSL